MGVKITPKDLNPDFYLLHPTKTCIYRMIIMPRVHDDNNIFNIRHLLIDKEQ